MTPLSDLMNTRSWEQDWPVASRSLRPVPETWGPLGDVVVDDVVVGHLLGGQPAVVTVQALRQAIAGMEEWNAWAAAYLTFPPTTRGLAQALATGLSPEAPTAIQELTPRLLSWYPAMTWAALDAHPDLIRQLPAEWQNAWWPETSPTSTAEAEAPSEPTAPSPRPAARARRERASSDEPNWLRETVLPVATKEGLAPLVAQEVGEAVKRHHNQTACANWSERVLLPALMTLTGSELEHLMRHWPSDLNFAVEDPVNFVKQGRFWALLRDAEPAAQARLVNDALPRVLVTDEWSAEDRLRMLRHMLGFTKNNRAIFEQRLELWQNWGGDLDERGVLNKDRAAEPGSEFDVSPAAKSGLDWIREQDVPVWNQWLADREAPAAPPRRPSPRMR